MINRIEIPLDRNYSDYLINLGKATHLLIEQCDGTDVYIKFEDVTTSRVRIKEDMRFEFEIPVQKIYLSANNVSPNAKLVFLVFSDMKIYP